MGGKASKPLNGALFGNRGKQQRSRAGFTMMEMLVAIAILVVASAAALIGIAGIMKNMQQAELDGTAKEIYIAAQNHLSQADSQSILSRKTDLGESAGGGVYYYVVTSDDPRLDEGTVQAKNSVLYQMLPYGAIEEKVRHEGTYIIKYDLDSATILGVFYARSNYSSLFAANTEGFTFVNEDYHLLFEDPDYTGDDKKLARQEYASASGDTVMVGYYGGEDLDSMTKAHIDKPTLRVVNAERLVAIVTNPNRFIDSTPHEGEDVNPGLKLIVSGKTSGAKKTIVLYENHVVNTSEGYVDSPDNGSTFYVYFDDVTQQNGHFANIFGPDGFLPGEDIDVQAVAYSNTRLSNVASSVKVRRNSLFSNVIKTVSNTDPTHSRTAYIAKISNIRHLENLGEDISGYDPADDEWNNTGATYADQIQDLSWDDFQLAVITNRAVGLQGVTIDDAVREEAAQVKVARLDNSGRVVDNGSFMPVNPSFALSYDGISHKISNIVIKSSSGDCGIFANLTDAEVLNLGIENPSIDGGSGSTGALVGKVTSSEINGVLVHNDEGNAATRNIESSSIAGGLVGEADDATITNCAAAVYVYSSAGDAGGLVGQSTNASKISESYTGGHTSEGRYLDSLDLSVQGHMNVIAAANAGGLVGSGRCDIENCYALASAHGGSSSGGLGGQVSGDIDNSYALGKVTSIDGGIVGALVGDAENVTADNCKYVEIINGGDVPAFGNGESIAEAVDGSTSSFVAFAQGTSISKPYDSALVLLYHNVYPYKNISSLAGKSSESLPSHATVNYGDWPEIETMVVNK